LHFYQKIKLLKALNIYISAKLRITKIDNAKDAQHSPSLYATFNLIYDGNLLVDHYISARRFENIIKKELNLKK